MAHRSVPLVVLSLMIISMSSVVRCYENAVSGSGHNPIATIHVFDDLSSCSKHSPFNQPSSVGVDVTLWCGPKKVAVTQTVSNPSGSVDFTFDLLDGLLIHKSDELGECLVTLTFPSGVCAADINPLNDVDVGSTVQQLIGIGDHENDVPKFEAKDFYSYPYHA